MKFENILDTVGNTPLVRIGEYKNAVLYGKREDRNPTGSLKDRTALGILQEGIRTGDLSPGKRVIDASSGSFACSVAFVAKLFGFETTVVVNSKISGDNLTFLKLLGTEIIYHGEVTGQGREYCIDLVSKEPEKWFFTNQLENPIAARMHELGTAPEIFADLNSVTAVVASKGSGATLCGVCRHVKASHPNTLVFGSVGIPGDVKKIAGTYVKGVDFRSPFVVELENNPAYTADIPIRYADAMNNCVSLLSKGILVGPQGGGVYQAAMQAIDERDLSGNVVIIAGDTILKNLTRFA